MKALWELLTPANDVHAVREFYDNMETYIRGLKSVGKTEEGYGDLLVPIIFDTLPGKMKTKISRDHRDHSWTLPQLKDAIYKKLIAI